MSEEKQEEANEEREDQVPSPDRYGLLCILAFAMLISSLFTASTFMVKACLIWMLVLRSYGLLVKKMNSMLLKFIPLGYCKRKE